MVDEAERDTGPVFATSDDPRRTPVGAFLRKYKGRVPCIHCKDILDAKPGAKAQLKPLGQGSLNWKDIFAAGREAGVEWYIYEQDSGEGSPFDYARASACALGKRSLGLLARARMTTASTPGGR